MSNDIRAFVESCDTCATFCARQPEQPLLTHEVPSRPWQKVRTDIFSISGRNYLVTVDYFSTFIEVDYLQDIASTTVIHKLKHQFARHGIPEVHISDNGTQYTSEEFAQFASEWKFQHTRSAPGNKKAKGAAEAAVKVIKNMMIKCRKSNEDPYIGLLNLRNTPTEGLATSPAQRLIGRRTQIIIPATDHALKRLSKIPVSDKFKMGTKKFKMSQKNIHRPNLGQLNEGDIVRMQPIDNTKEWKEAKVTKTLGHNTFEVFDGSKFFRRNRQFLRKRKSRVPIRSTHPTSNNPPLNPGIRPMPSASHPTQFEPLTGTMPSEQNSNPNPETEIDHRPKPVPDTDEQANPLMTRS
ncbi:endogenous retrovirus group k member 19 pol protein [Plakobranchus ocellatus]|uniref:Endogenous retrovirus group k member 19 pol protein n=1 Tax=Plakobranchus ocellatus TaxID=259542 RepID=A0AAV4D4E6_9GAST|nr:endogenous retrovirus group k member 19 pol protein [Plakobranchus ocellatus]